LAIRNPSKEELEALKKGKVEPLVSNPIEKQPTIQTKQVWNADELKPKKSRFEPDPQKFYLPSGIKFVETGYLWVRRMNTEEESKFANYNSDLSSVNSFNVIINSVLNGTVKSNYPINELPLFDKLPLFLFIIGISFGDKININKIKKDCEDCTEEYEFIINYNSDGVYTIMPETKNHPFVITLESFEHPYTVCFHYPKIKNETSIANKDISLVLSDLIIYLRDNNGIDIPKEEWAELIRWINLEDKLKISENINTLNSFGTTIKFPTTNCTNPGCKLQEVVVKTEELFTNSIFNR
jgi:hypothetical protein